MNTLGELQHRWAAGQLIGLDILCQCADFATEIDIDAVESTALTHAFGREYRFSMGRTKALDEWLGDDDVWSQVQVNNQLRLASGQMILCGEGEMGNEGFIARTDTDNRLEWFLFSTTSNPFVGLWLKEGQVYVKSTHNFCLVLNLQTEDVTVLN